MALRLKNPLILALDIDSKSEVLHLTKTLGPQVGALKIGPRLVIRYGADLISQLAQSALIFIDLKFLDIPNTMKTSVQSAFDAGASLVTVHGWAGVEALTELAKLEKELNKKRPFLILVVTILTSFRENELPYGLEKKTIKDHVVGLIDEAYKVGLRGFVCSPEEASVIRAKYPDAILVTPGVRLPDEEKGDQKRVMGPKEALDAGSTALVVGRPIVESKNPQQILEKYLKAIQK